MDSYHNKSFISKKIFVVIILFVLILPFDFVNGAIIQTSHYSSLGIKNNDPYALTIENATGIFESVIGCTNVTNKIAAGIEQVIVGGEKFGSKISSRFKEIFNSDEKSEPNFLSDDTWDKYSWKANSDDTSVLNVNKFIENTGVTPGTPVADVAVQVNTKNTLEKQKELNEIAESELKEAERKRVVEQCLSGVAYTLAKKQLAKTTNDTLNWINTGLGGDPLFVKDQASYLQNIADQQLLAFVRPMIDNQNPSSYPYARDFARSALLDRSTTWEERSVSSMDRYIQPNESVDNWDFTWKAWLGFTQNEANNPLGYQLIATEELAKRQNEAQEIAKAELDQGNGFLSQKECVEWWENGETITRTTDPTTGEEVLIRVEDEIDERDRTVQDDVDDINKISENKSDPENYYTTSNYNSVITGPDSICLKWEIITPGSVISNQVNTVLTSPIRQLELADDINESLSFLFQSMLTNLMNRGLRGLDKTMNEEFASSHKNNFLGNFYDSLGNNLSLLPGYSNERDVLLVNQGYGFNGNNFDITIDLGDITGDVYYEGCKNASGSPISCLAKDNPNDKYKINKLVLDECSDGKDNDKDGLTDAEDPNCKTAIKGVVKKGLITLQKDYIDAVKASQAELEHIMPALGALDYCIPGPNPGWRTEATKEVNASIEFLRSLSLNDNKEIQSAFGKIADLEKAYSESRAGYGLQVAGQAATIIGTGFGPVGTVVGGLVGMTFNVLAQKEANEALDTFNDEKERVQRFIVKEKEKFDEDRARGIVRLIKTFNSYEEDYEKLYGQNSLMRTPSTLFEKNNYYLPMADAGIELTKDMRIYSRNIDKAYSDYTGLVTETEANIYRLEQIKKKVDVIVLRAKVRRENEIKSGKLVVAPECYGLIDLNLPAPKPVNIGGTNETGGGGISGGGTSSGGTNPKNNNTDNVGSGTSGGSSGSGTASGNNTGGSKQNTGSNTQ